MSPETAQIFGGIGPLISMVSAIGVGGWVLVTTIRSEKDQRVDCGAGQQLYPLTTEPIERVRLLSKENRQLRDELGSIKDRLGIVERIVTNSSHVPDREIDARRLKAN